ncbi:toxin [Pantoea stewartii]|uniref:toxin n=1 Tax=Pantoea stewartii TaxID=66269 RepID=UPI001CF770E6|nr:toxin [Pantoea stewartii]
MLLANPEKGDIIPDTGRLGKVRFWEERTNKGTRCGIRVIYYWTDDKGQFILFTTYYKDQRDDLTKQQRDALVDALNMNKKGLRRD